MAVIDPEVTTLNELIERYPQTLPILQRHELDCCCGGALPVGEAARRHDVDVPALMEAVRGALSADVTDP